MKQYEKITITIVYQNDIIRCSNSTGTENELWTPFF